ncbi:hypothetical protein LTS15_006469 [Exophiala xenobiotica]|nr:hypothetical protein LTS15_006469 [Exophiala xenobiotica]
METEPMDTEDSQASIPSHTTLDVAAGPTTTTTSTRTPADDAVATEVGYLTLTATGEARYLGTSSGMGLANLIGSVLDYQHVVSNWRGEKNGDLGGRNPQPTCLPSDAPIPPRKTADAFIDSYFAHTHITFPLLHRRSFLAAVQQIYDNPNYYALHTFDAFAFDMVLSIGSSNFNRFEESTAGSGAHYARARTKMNAVLNMGGLVPLQAILLLSQHGIFSNLRDTSASIWHLVGMGARISFELGLHLEPKRMNQRLEHPIGSNLPITFEVEMRKRTFWCFYNLDRVVSFTLGRPVALRDEDMDISLPSHLPDEDFGPDRPIPPPSSQPDTDRVSPFLHLIKIRHLSGKILSTMYAAKHRSDIPLDEKVRVRRQLYEEIIEWRESTRSLKLEDRAKDKQGYISCFLTPEWYEAVANNALLLLYRPSPYLPHPVVPTKETGEPGDLQHMFNAARASITSYYELHRKRRLNYSWITLHGVFIAGLAYIYGIGRALKDPRQGMPIPDYLDIINDTRSCSNILVAICERWNVARSSCELFNRLSTAVIKDAITAATNKDLSVPVQSHSLSNPLHQGGTAEGTPTRLNMQSSARRSHQRGGGEYEMPLSAAGVSNQFDHMFVADEFRQYTSGLDSFLVDDNLPSELVMGFSQDWPFEEAHFESQDGYDIPLAGFGGTW